MDPDELLCAKEVSALLKVSPRVAARLMRVGELPGWKFSGKYWRTSRFALRQYIAAKLQRRAACA